jgi:protein transport protein SEC24
MLAISDIHDVFLPQPDDLLVNLHDSYDLVIQLLDSFENFFLPRNGHPKTNESCFIPALNTANTISKHIGGRLMLF